MNIEEGDRIADPDRIAIDVEERGWRCGDGPDAHMSGDQWVGNAGKATVPQMNIRAAHLGGDGLQDGASGFGDGRVTAADLEGFARGGHDGVSGHAALYGPGEWLLDGVRMDRRPAVFSDEQVCFFRREGWLAVPDFWSRAEIRALRVELDRLAAEGKLRNVATDGDGTTMSSTRANLQLCPLWPHSRLFQAMPFAPKVGEAVAQLIGEPVLLHLDQVFVKPGRHGIGTNWHQDNAYFRIPDPLAGTALWTAVHDATGENGAMRVIPRRFTEALPHGRDPYSDHHIRCWPDESEAVLVELPAGGALFFAYGTPHCTGANRTDAARAGVALHFLRSDQTDGASGGFAPEERPLVVGPGACGGTEVYGRSLFGVWDECVSRTNGCES